MQVRKKVLFFTSPEVGGAERMTITIAKMLETARFDIKFVVVGPRLGNIASFIPDEFPVELLKIHNIWDFTLMRMRKLLRREKPDVVFCSLIYLNVRVIMAARIVGGIKVIVRNNIGLDVIGKLNLCLCRLAYPKADTVIAQQEEMHEDILKRIHIKNDKVIVLHNPIDTETIDKKVAAPSPYSDPLSVKYVWVGRVSYVKGQDVLVEAFRIIHDKDQNSKLYFIGKYNEGDQYYKSLMKMLHDYGLEECVTFVGFDDNPYRWIKHCDCFIQPSRLEGLPNALIEAMYIGRPVVATRCIPIVDRIVKENYNGFVVDPEDWAGMAKAMKRALALTDFSATYKSSSKEDIVKLF